MAIQAPNIKVLGARLVVLQDTVEEKTAGGLILPDKVNQREKPLTGTVVGVGQGFWTTEGTRVSMDIEVGDKVIWTNLGGVPVQIGETTYLVINESHIIAVTGKEKVLPHVTEN